MKTLKFDHSLAALISKGQKTTTWRLYDDKDLMVNDVVNLVDKVDPDKPATWKVIGTATINRVVQKRIGDIGPEDYEGHEEFESKKQMIETYRRYYGSQVDESTPIKIVNFHLLTKHSDLQIVDNPTMKLSEVKLYADGGSRGNPGPSASGFVIMNLADKIVVKKSFYLGVTTNNQAEYKALELGLQEAGDMHVQTVHVFMDSLLVINQMLGIFKVKNRDLWPIHAAIKELASGFKRVTYTHIPRALNKMADAAVNEALDEQAKK